MKIIQQKKHILRSSEVLPLNELFSEASSYDRGMIKGNIPDKFLQNNG
jgi:hypothetical protein